MKIIFKDKGNKIVYTKGTTQEQIIKFIDQRIEKRQKEIDKRQWIVDEHKRLCESQALDREWSAYLVTHPDFIPPIDKQ